MIFKALFAPKHEHSKASVRISALQRLDRNDDDDNAILKALSTADKDGPVRLEALKKLNDLSAWHTALIQDPDKAVKTAAQSFIEHAVVNREEARYSTDTLLALVLNSEGSQLLERCVQNAAWHVETAAMLQMLQKLNKPNISQKVMMSSQDSGLQRALLEGVSDLALLEKYRKKAVDLTIKNYLSERIEKITNELKIVNSAEQHVTLVLSKLLALSDSHNYLEVEQKLQQLKAQFEQDYNVLQQHAAEKYQSIVVKYDQLVQRNNDLLAKLEPAYRAQCAESAKLQHQQAQYRIGRERLQQVTDLLANDASSITLGQLEELQHRLQQSIKSIQPLPSHIDGEQLLNALNSTLASLNKLPSFQQSIDTARQLLQEFAAIELPSDLMTMPDCEAPLVDFRQRYRQLATSYGELWPSAMQQEFAGVIAPWKTRLKDHRKEIDSRVEQVRGGLRKIEQMISQGRYRAAIGLSEKLARLWLRIPVHFQQRMQRKYQQIQQQVSELQDLQQFIASPRKPELIQQLQDLIDEPLKVSEQADRVKVLRQQYNSLGKQDNSQDQALNQTFDNLCEQAFAPCRAHYQAQQQLRSENLELKYQLLQSLGDLQHNNEISQPELVKSVRQLQNQWRQIGQVDFEQREALKLKYSQAISPLLSRVDDFYQQNTEQKQQLIKQAEAIAEQDSCQQGIVEAKQLQGRWKTIGHAGKAQEDVLWSAFRQAMDTIFDKQKQQYQRQSEQQAQHCSALDQLIESYSQSIDGESSHVISQLFSSLQQAAMEHMDPLPRGTQQAYQQRIDALSKAQQQAQREQSRQLERQRLQQLFEVLACWQDNQPPVGVDDLAAKWRTLFETQANTSNYDRHALTLLIEIAAEVDSPKADGELRSRLQLEVMAERLQTGASLEQHELLRQWISLGPVSSSEQPFLARIKALMLD